MKKLRAEIASVCETDSVLSRSTLRRMSFLQKILKEGLFSHPMLGKSYAHDISLALRLYPSVPLNFRTALRDTVLPVGGGPDGKAPISIAKGKTVVFCLYALHRRRDLYGMDATSFRPERWDEDMPVPFDSVNTKWGYIPFGAGPRTCLGSKLMLPNCWALIDADSNRNSGLRSHGSCLYDSSASSKVLMYKAS
jgi:hypothetical protein